MVASTVAPAPPTFIGTVSQSDSPTVESYVWNVYAPVGHAIAPDTQATPGQLASTKVAREVTKLKESPN
jgi:hypothetical protein